MAGLRYRGLLTQGLKIHRRARSYWPPLTSPRDKKTPPPTRDDGAGQPHGRISDMNDQLRRLELEVLGPDVVAFVGPEEEVDGTTFRGAWSDIEVYLAGDVVTHEGHVWMSTGRQAWFSPDLESREPGTAHWVPLTTPRQP